VLVFGCGYRKIADQACSATTIRDRRDHWIALGIFQTLELLVLDAYDRMVGLELGDLAVDGCITKAPCGGDAAGRSPLVTRGGLKRMGELGLALALPSSTLRGELGWQLWDLGRWQEAEELVGEELTRVHPVAGALHLRLLSGRLHMGRGRFDLAHEQGQTTARLVGHLVDPLLHGFLQHYLAELATLQGDYSTALSAVDKAPAAPCRLRGTRAHGSLVSYRPSSRRRRWRARPRPTRRPLCSSRHPCDRRAVTRTSSAVACPARAEPSWDQG
jgi:hypothetical protein